MKVKGCEGIAKKTDLLHILAEDEKGDRKTNVICLHI